MRKRGLSPDVTTLAILATLLLSMSTLISSSRASSVIADQPRFSWEGAKPAWFPSMPEWWCRGDTTAAIFNFTGINTTTIPGDKVKVNMKLRITNHIDGDFGLDGLVDITINPGVPGYTYTMTDVLFDNVDPENHLARWGERTYERYECTARKNCTAITVYKKYIRNGTLVVKVDRHTDDDGAPSVTTCTYARIIMTTPPIVPPNCYEDDDAHTVHIGVKVKGTADPFNTTVAAGWVTITTIPPSIGGFSVPVDKLGLLAPYIALAVAVVAVTIGAVSARKRWSGNAALPKP